MHCTNNPKKFDLTRENFLSKFPGAFANAAIRYTYFLWENRITFFGSFISDEVRAWTELKRLSPFASQPVLPDIF